MLQMRTLRPRSLKALGRGHRAGRSPRPHAPSSARTPGHWAPVLVPTSTLHHLKPRFAAPTGEPLEAGTTNLSRQAVAGRSSGYRSGAEGAQERHTFHPTEAVGVKSSRPSRREARKAGRGTGSCSAHRSSQRWKKSVALSQRNFTEWSWPERGLGDAGCGHDAHTRLGGPARLPAPREPPARRLRTVDARRSQKTQGHGP